MNVRRLFLNAGSAAFQVVLSTGILFVVYGYIVREIGLNLFGVWVTVAASTTVAAIGGLGLAGGVVKYVSRYRALEDMSSVCLVLSTSLISAAISLGVMAAAGLVILPVVLPLFLTDPAELAVGLELVPYVVGSFWLNSVAGIGVSGLDGFNRMELRAGAYTIAMLVFAGLVVYLLPRHGVVGIVEAQMTQGAVLLVVTWSILGKLTPQRGPIPIRWSWSVFKEIVRYGVNFQIMSISQVLFEPTAKALLTRFGGAGATGLFEMANRLAFQARTFIDASHRTMVPSIAELHELDPEALPGVYERSARLLVMVAASLLPILVLSAPVVSVVWLGALNPTFVIIASVLSAAWMLNLLATPAFYANLGTGLLRGNVVGAVTTATLNVVLGIALGIVWSSTGVIAAFVIAMLVGNAVIAWEYHRRNPDTVGAFLGASDFPLVLSSCLISIAGAVTASDLLTATNPVIYSVGVAAVFATFILPLSLRHSAYRMLRSAIQKRLAGRAGSRQAS